MVRDGCLRVTRSRYQDEGVGGCQLEGIMVFFRVLGHVMEGVGGEDEDEEGRERGPKGNRGGAEEAGYGVGVGGPTRKDCCQGEICCCVSLFLSCLFFFFPSSLLELIIRGGFNRDR